MLSIDSTGQASGSVNGRLSSSGGTLVFTPDDGDLVTIHPNASGTFAIAEDSQADYFGLIALVRVAAEPAASFDQLIGLQCAMDSSGQVVCSWNEATSLVLSRSEDFIHWTPLPASPGASSHVEAIQAPAAFYRIEQAPAGQ